MDDERDTDERSSELRSLADRADDGFVSLVRAAGTAVRRIEASSARGVGRIARTLKREKKAEPAQAEADESAEGLDDLGRRPSAGPAPNPYDLPPSATDGPSAAAGDPTVSSPTIGELPSAVRPRDHAPEPPPEAAPERASEAGGPSGAGRSPGTKGVSAPDAERAKPGAAATEADGKVAGRPSSSRLALPMLDAKSLIENHPLGDRLPDRAQLLPVVQKLLHGTQDVRLRAKRVLVGLGGAVAEPILVAVLRGASPELADVVLEGLADLRSPRFRGCVAAVIAAHEVEMRLVALRGAQRLPGDAARPFFAHASLDSEPAVRRRAVLYLSWRSEDWAAAALRALCEDREVMVRMAALRCLAAARPAMAREAIGSSGDRVGPVFRRFIVGLVGAPDPAEQTAQGAEPAEGQAGKPAAATGPDTAEGSERAGASRESSAGAGSAADGPSSAVEDAAPASEDSDAGASAPAESGAGRASPELSVVAGAPRTMKAEASAVVGGPPSEDGGGAHKGRSEPQ